MSEIDKIVTRLITEGQKFSITFNPPASEVEIEKFEIEAQIKLPADIKEFYKACNGFDTFDLLFRIIPLQDILQDIPNLPPNRFRLAEYMIYADSWIVEVRDDGKYVILNNNHGIEEERVLCDSLIVFLNRYLECDGAATENGLYKGFDEIKYSRENSKQPKPE